MPEFSQQLFDNVCEQLARGKSLRAICEQEGMPSTTSVMNWLKRDKSEGGALIAQYARAREEHADSIVDEIMEIADDARNDWMKTGGDDDEGYRFNGEHVQRSKLRIDARKWRAAKLRPKVYGDKFAFGGADDLPPVKTEPKTDIELARAIAFALRKAEEGE